MRYETGQDFENCIGRRYRVENHGETKGGNALGGDFSGSKPLRRFEAGNTVRTCCGGGGGVGERLGRSRRCRAGTRQVHGADRERRRAGCRRISAAAGGNKAGFSGPLELAPRGGGATSPHRSRSDGTNGNRGS